MVLASFALVALTRKVVILDHLCILNGISRQLLVSHLRSNWILYFTWQVLLLLLFLLLFFFFFPSSLVLNLPNYTVVSLACVINWQLFQPKQKKTFANIFFTLYFFWATTLPLRNFSAVFVSYYWKRIIGTYQSLLL